MACKKVDNWSYYYKKQQQSTRPQYCLDAYDKKKRAVLCNNWRKEEKCSNRHCMYMHLKDDRELDDWLSYPEHRIITKEES